MIVDERSRLRSLTLRRLWYRLLSPSARISSDFHLGRTHHATFPRAGRLPERSAAVPASERIGGLYRLPTESFRQVTRLWLARSRRWEAPSCSAAVFLNLILSEAIVHVEVSISTAATSPVVCPQPQLLFVLEGFHQKSASSTSYDQQSRMKANVNSMPVDCTYVRTDRGIEARLFSVGETSRFHSSTLVSQDVILFPQLPKSESHSAFSPQFS